MRSAKPLTRDQLYRSCDLSGVAFETTDDLPEFEETIGQDRAVRAIDFGLRMRGSGYNLYVLGPQGEQKRSLVLQHLESKASGRDRPPDWCYVNRFTDPQRPRAIALPAGRGAELREDMRKLVDELRVSIPAVFESEEYRQRMAELEEEFEERHKQELGALQEEAERRGMTLLQTPHGFAVAPTVEGKVIGPEDFERLSNDDKRRLEQTSGEIREKVRKYFETMPERIQQHRRKQKELERGMTMGVVGRVIEDLQRKYPEPPQVSEYLGEVRDDIVENVQAFRKLEGGPLAVLGLPVQDRAPSFGRYEVNLFVDRSDLDGAPVVYESNPNYPNLLGRVEHQAQMGTLVTDFRWIRAGALHRANGGFLVVDAERLLMQPYAYEGLKRTLFSGTIHIEGLAEMLGWVGTVSLEPEPVPLDVKVVVLGSRLLYYLLCLYDPDFEDLFKVASDLEEQIDRTEENVTRYARLVGTLARKHGLRPFDRGAVARVIEHAGRLAQDSEKLTARLATLTDVLREADQWAADSGNDVIGGTEVERAIEGKIERLDRIRDEIQETIRRGTLLIDTDGERAGQVNGLSVLQLGEFSFGVPTRITATARLGSGKVVDIQREVELGGAIHSKGMMIVAAYLGGRFLPDMPLSLSANVVFEQTYSSVEGDSATVAEVAALLSALSGVPILQSRAVTGSMNQLGRVQAIGGVNDKIEGFFDVCRARGLTGQQGVLIPADNVKHLMLRRDVVEAAAACQFHVWPVETLDEALTLLTGADAGERNEAGEFPEGTVNRRVEDRLREFARRRREYAAETKL